MNLATEILTGDMPASVAIGHPELYDALTIGASGKRLPILGSSVKIAKGLKVGVLSAVLYMQPAKLSGREACPGRSEGCTAACLSEAVGHMSMPTAQRGRARKHAAFFADRKRFLADLCADIAAHESRAIRAGKACAVRLNGTTDLPWHRMPVVYNGTRYPNVHSAFPNVQFYEYTKMPLSIVGKGAPANLHLTFSLSERDDADSRAAEFLADGRNVAVVMAAKRHALPETFAIGDVSYPVIDGDIHDARFLDDPASIVGLSAKGRAKRDLSGFTRAVN